MNGPAARQTLAIGRGAQPKRFDLQLACCLSFDGTKNLLPTLAAAAAPEEARNGQGFEVAEDVDYAGVHMQNWVMACFGYQYLPLSYLGFGLLAF